MKNQSFSKKYDELFEKPKTRLFVSRRMRIILSVGVLILSGLILYSVLALPKLLEDSAATLNASLDNYLRNMEEIDEQFGYKQHQPLLEKKIRLEYHPNYENVLPYNVSIVEGNIDFGNGYVLEVTDGAATLEDDFSSGLEIKADEGMVYKGAEPSVDRLASYKYDIVKYHDTYDAETQTRTYYTDRPYDSTNYVTVYVSGNLIDNLSLYVAIDDETAFYELFPLDNIGEVKTGLILNTTLHDTYLDETERTVQKSYITLYRYWLFPDGMGIYLSSDDIFYGLLTHEEGDNTTEENLAAIDRATQIFAGEQSMLTWLDSTFQLKKVD